MEIKKEDGVCLDPNIVYPFVKEKIKDYYVDKIEKSKAYIAAMDYCEDNCPPFIKNYRESGSKGGNYVVVSLTETEHNLSNKECIIKFRKEYPDEDCFMFMKCPDCGLVPEKREYVENYSTRYDFSSVPRLLSEKEFPKREIIIKCNSCHGIHNLKEWIK